MKEKNYKRLREALDALPDYGAAAGAWERIEKAMSPGLSEKLPGYRPPANVWNGISQGLDATAKEEAAVQKPARVRKLWPRLVGVAAAAALVVSAAIGVVRNYDAGPTVTYAITREPAPAPIVADWGQEAENFARVVAEIKTRNEPHLNNLGHELAELTAASEEVQAMLVAYGDDPGIVRQLADIERDRSDIYRQIIVEL